MFSRQHWLTTLALLLTLLAGVSAYLYVEEVSPRDAFDTVFRTEALVTRLAAEIEIDRDAFYSVPDEGQGVPARVAAQLDNDAHAVAKQQWCEAQPDGAFRLDERLSCVPADEATCLALSATGFYDYANASLEGLKYTNPILAWTNDRCVQSWGNGNVCANAGFELAPAEVECDADGLCTQVGRGPTCVIPEAYCRQQGADYAVGNGLGECTVSVAQEFVEALGGVTYTRRLKGAMLDVANDCETEGPLACGSALGRTLLTGQSFPGQILLDTSRLYYTEAFDNFQRNCLEYGDTATPDAVDDFQNNPAILRTGARAFPVDGRHFFECSMGLFRFFPSYAFIEMGTSMLKGMITLFGGEDVAEFLTNEKLYEGLSYGFQYGGKALDAVVKYGDLAVTAIGAFGPPAFEELGDLLGAGLQDLSAVGDLASYRALWDATRSADYGRALAFVGGGFPTVGRALLTEGLSALDALALLDVCERAEQLGRGLAEAFAALALFGNFNMGVFDTVLVQSLLGAAFGGPVQALAAGVSGLESVGTAVADASSLAKDVVAGVGEAADAVSSAVEAVGNFASSLF